MIIYKPRPHKRSNQKDQTPGHREADPSGGSSKGATDSAPTRTDPARPKRRRGRVSVNNRKRQKDHTSGHRKADPGSSSRKRTADSGARGTDPSVPKNGKYKISDKRHDQREILPQGETNQSRGLWGKTTMPVATQTDTTIPAVVTNAAEYVDRPFQSSYFLPGRIEGVPVQFLIDTGCNTNLLSKQVFDRLPERIRAGLEESDTHGVMADGTRLPFYGVLRVAGRLRDVKIEEAFVVSRLGEDVILGMPFLAAHQCTLSFGKPLLAIGKRELACTDRHGRLLETKVQAVRKVTIPASTEMTIQCRVTTKNYFPLGIIEGETKGAILAASLNQPDRAGRVMVRCLNLTNQPVTLAAGITVGTYTGVEGQDVSTTTEGSDDRIPMPLEELRRA